VVVIAVRGRDNYWRYTLYSWLLEVKDILEYELDEHFEITVLDGESEDPELLVDGELVGRGIPGEEGYLIEILKKALAARGYSRRTTR
jgi:hypothetical protein